MKQVSSAGFLLIRFGVTALLLTTLASPIARSQPVPSTVPPALPTTSTKENASAPDSVGTRQRDQDRARQLSTDASFIESAKKPVDIALRCSIFLAERMLNEADLEDFKVGLNAYDEIFGRMSIIIASLRYVQAHAALPEDRGLQDALAKDFLAEQIPEAIACSRSDPRICAAWSVGTSIGMGINEIWRQLEAARLRDAGRSDATARTAQKALTDFYHELFNNEQYTQPWLDAQSRRHLDVNAMQRLVNQQKNLSTRINSELTQQNQQYQTCKANVARQQAQGASQDLVGDLLRRQRELMQNSAEGLDKERESARQAGQSIFDKPVPMPTPLPMNLPSTVGRPGLGDSGSAINRPGCTYDQSVAEMGRVQQCQNSCTARTPTCGALVAPGKQESCRSAQQALDNCLRSCGQVRAVCR